MNNSKKLFGIMAIAIILCISLTLSAVLSSSQVGQMTQKLQTTDAQLASLNTSPILTATANVNDQANFKNMIMKDIANIKDDLNKIQKALKALIENQKEMLKNL